VVEVWRELQGVDELGIETRGHLDAHTAEEQPDVHAPQIRLLVPWRLVLLDEASDDGVGGAANVDHLDEFSTFSSFWLDSLLLSWVMQGGREAVGLAGSVPPVVLRNQHLNVFWGYCRSYYTRPFPRISPLPRVVVR
jgi:hypothetical protein